MQPGVSRDGHGIGDGLVRALQLPQPVDPCANGKARPIIVCSDLFSTEMVA